MIVVDRERLVDFLHQREEAQSVLVAAIYRGLRDRIERGDFDEEVS